MSKFKVGQVVLVIIPVGEERAVNQRGVIKTIDSGGAYGIEFFNDIDGHDINDKGKIGYCWWVFDEDDMVGYSDKEEIE